MSPTRSARLRAMPVRRRGLRDDTGASLLLAMFAVLFVSIVVSVMVTGLDGGIRQNTQVALTQNDRIATSGALQAAIALTSRSSYAVGSLACPIGNGFTYSDPTFGSVRITCKSVKEDALSASGDSNLDLGDDAVVLTDQGPDGKGGWVENNPGWVYVAGSVRVAAPSSSTSSVLANGLTGNACATLQTDPNASSHKACGQIWSAATSGPEGSAHQGSTRSRSAARR